MEKTVDAGQERGTTALPVTPAGSEALLRTHGIERRFGSVAALAGVDIDVARNKITGLIGPNGAGKTTFFNLIAGLIAPSAGRVIFDGTDVTGWRPDRLAAVGLTRTFQIARGLAELTVLENLLLYAPNQPGETVGRAIVRPASARKREEEALAEAWRIAERLKLDGVANRRASALSGGQKKLLELGRALMAKPKLLMLDEPMAGVNPALARLLMTELMAINRMGVTMLVIEHNMGVISEICDDVIVLAAGRVLAHGPFAEIRANHAVQSAYLGSRS